MEFPINLVLQLQNEQEYNLVERALDPDSHIDKSEISTFTGLVNRIEYRRPDSSREARVRIGISEISQGTIEEMEARFRTECAMHSNSNVIMDEWINGGWKQVHARKLQTL